MGFPTGHTWGVKQRGVRTALAAQRKSEPPCDTQDCCAEEAPICCIYSMRQPASTIKSFEDARGCGNSSSRTGRAVARVDQVWQSAGMPLVLLFLVACLSMRYADAMLCLGVVFAMYVLVCSR